MNKVVEFLNANQVQYLATVGRDGKAKCRPFMFAGEMEGEKYEYRSFKKERNNEIFFEFPVPLSPSFARMDLSDYPALIGAFALGPVCGVLAEFVKNALQLQ